ncbi:ring-hydroxylating oxygenase subunit alpha [Hansschlegelia sp.]|uniref:ring-hydroxylating oxygenase subunit alpha n=1 Tax=Hansschlegelia sp. TaxID=2041892 RepID=UPI002C55FF37|nr:ring-hydroxylating oxygenase subunit alpha [Hansschlegelia sp.]HVI30243.1 ring-hydroxylating oxygenase subunit alpha [Hansschlegelia sp.]
MSNRPDLGYFDEGQDLASAAFYAEALKPPGEARVLPPAAFRSLAFTALEDEAVWTRDWICVGAHEAIPGVGDLLPFTVGTHGVHVQRTEEGLKARFNKAQHGGCRAVPLQCQTGAKTRCSFTSCGHSRDRAAIPAGELGDGTPEMHQYLGLRPERLLTAQVRSWGPLIFVNLDVTPESPEASLKALNKAAGFFGNHKPLRSEEIWLEFPANWKLLAQALAAGEPIVEDEDAGWLLARTELSDATDTVTAWLFPNLVLLATDRETCTLTLQPSAIGQTICRVSLYGASPDADALARWRSVVEARAAAAVAGQFAASRWGASFRPETVGAPLPVQTDPHGQWMARALARRIARVPRAALPQPLFQTPRS